MEARRTVAAAVALLGAVASAHTVIGVAPLLVNPGFEEASADGAPLGWTIMHGLDPHRYGPPELRFDFGEIRPTCGQGGYLSSRCLAFPASGTWWCPVFAHRNGDGKGIDGRQLGKAAVYQTVDLPAGRYRFAVRLRTAEGHFYSAAFALGVNIGAAANYANDGSTGIRWSANNLAMARSLLRDAAVRGEWTTYSTEPFEVKQAGPVTVWIRFNYANENQMRARWQADDAAIVPVEAETAGSGPAHRPCQPPPPTWRWRQVPGDLEGDLSDAGGSTLADASEVRLFRRSRVIPPGDSVRYRLRLARATDGHNAPQAYSLQREPSKSPRYGSPTLLAAIRGEAVVDVGGTAFRLVGYDPRLPTAAEWGIPESTWKTKDPVVTVHATGAEPARLYELEAGCPGRTALRLLYVEADVVNIPWTVGVWDASAREFGGDRHLIETPARVDAATLVPGGRWEIRFTHAPVTGHRYRLTYGLLGGTVRVDVGADGIIDWVAESRGEEIVDFDVTDLLRTGSNVVTVETSGQHDFAAMVETCPGSTDLRKLRLCFEGDELATLLTRVVENTWFWLRELHYEPSGFIDASVPKGKWYNQYWPVDIAFALREWVRWGHHDESCRTAMLVADRGWHGHESNRSGGADNTGGNILSLQLCEILRRSDATPGPDSPIWQRVRAHCAEVIRNVHASPCGLVRGTNWENAGNRENGPCYALSTNLGAAAALRKAATLAEQIGEKADADAWRSAARGLRQTVLDRLVLKADHRCPSGFVLPKGTWAYGLRTDGSIEDRPLAGYFWAGADPPDVEGFIAADKEVLAVYDRTLQAAMPLFELEHTGTVSGYAASYDGPDASLVLAALCDRIDSIGPLLRALVRQTDTGDVGSQFAELSRWAYGAPNDAEDTNLVCAAGFLWGLRALVGIDDVLADGGRLHLVPRLPWTWNRMIVNDWPVRCRDASGRLRWTRLSFDLERSERQASVHLRTADEVAGVSVRLGPFRRDRSVFAATSDGRATAARPEVGGDAAWAWASCDCGPDGVFLQVSAEP